MQPKMILESDVLDILFENRNKDYGAYMLRREYQTRVQKALLFTFSLMALAMLGLCKFSKADGITGAAKWNPIDTVRLVNVKLYPPLAQSGGAKKSTPHVTGKALTKPVIVPDEKIAKIADAVKPSEDKPVTANNTSLGSSGPANSSGDNGNSGKAGVGNGSNDGGGSELDGPAANPDIVAQFPGGNKAMQRFLKDNMDRPTVDDDQVVEVKVRFLINADGSISSMAIVKSGGEECDADALKALKKMPDWIPAKVKGHNVAMWFIIPFQFSDNDG